MEKDSRFYKRVEDLMDFDKETFGDDAGGGRRETPKEKPA